MQIIFNDNELEEIQEMAGKYEIDACDLVDRYVEMLESNFNQDLVDIKDAV